jgi:hypothetical protein
MKGFRLFAVTTAVTLLIGGVYLLFVFHQRQNPGVVAQYDSSQQLTADDVAVVRMEFPQHFDDLQNLVGKSIWMKNGYVIPAFPYPGGRIDFSKPVGLIPPGQRLDVKKVVRAVTPASVDDAMSHGTRQAFYIVTEPGSTNQLAVPVGSIEGSQEMYFSDLLFFYDDPHTVYDHWPKDVWTAIDAHQAKPGMSELQTRMALGQKMQSESRQEGDRTVTYILPDKKITVTFRGGKATAISQQ